MTIPNLYALFLTNPLVSTDSRKIETGCLFFALKGDNFDGNQFAQGAIERGAAYAIVDDPAVVKSAQYILVDQVLITLQDLARYHRQQFHIPIIGITGSNGKTTTKELISAVLGSHYRLHFTQGNFNNHIGVPLTLLAMPPKVEVAVIEMGANAQREIDMLSRICEPTHGLITNIGKAHLEGFGGMEGVKKGKSELYHYLAETGGLAFINRDEKFLEDLAEPVKKKIFYCQSQTLSKSYKPIEIQLIAEQPFVRFAFLDDDDQLLTADSHLMGIYNFNNIMTAVALGKYFKVPAKKIKSAIETYVPNMNRSELQQAGTNTFLMDAYNANPSSMESALKAFAQSEVQKKVAILGDMFELGEDTVLEHERIATLAVSLNIDQVILVGQHFSAAAQSLHLQHFVDGQALKPWFQAQQWENTHFLIKGSRGMRMEQFLES
jgi:UDP-N-acetylmuramoyl-tripeptide--D-alanyl-D-alanine ligase